MGFEDCARRLRIAFDQNANRRGDYGDMVTFNLRCLARSCEGAAEHARETYEHGRRVALWGATPTEDRRAAWEDALAARERMEAAETMAAATRCALAAAKAD